MATQTVPPAQVETTLHDVRALIAGALGIVDQLAGLVMQDTTAMEPGEADADAARRLDCLQTMLMEIATDINTARHTLRESKDGSPLANLVADALDRIGWMTERASTVAGAPYGQVAGDADGWMLQDKVQRAIKAIERNGMEAPHG